MIWTWVGQHLKFSYNDPASTDLAMRFAAIDPFLRRESEAISADFARMEAASLEKP
jgi:hypothetical protein